MFLVHHILLVLLRHLARVYQARVSESVYQQPLALTILLLKERSFHDVAEMSNPGDESECAVVQFS